MNQETDETKAAIAALAELGTTLSGAAQAMEVIQDVLVSTLLMTQPHLALTMAAHLEQRYDLVPGSLDGSALVEFQKRINNFRRALELLGPRNT